VPAGTFSIAIKVGRVRRASPWHAPGDWSDTSGIDPHRKQQGISLSSGFFPLVVGDDCENRCGRTSDFRGKALRSVGDEVEGDM